MALYTIIRVYEVSADNQQQATDRMMEALALHVERDYQSRMSSVCLARNPARAQRLTSNRLQAG
jgi:hypothetical protein